MSDLFEPITIGSIQAKNRVFMAPLTRGRADRNAVPTPLMVTYYTQRASAGLITTEGTGISREGLSWAWAPGIWSQEQVAAWKPVTESVHAHGGKIVLQLWHMGRGAHSSITGLQPVSASATTYPADFHTYDGKKPAEQARELTKEDIKRIVGDFHQAALNAIEAGFDGVQIHAANGYLIDQFLRDSTNLRTDEYGGSIENRVRFLDEVVAAVVAAVGAERTGVRFSPNGASYGVIDSHPESLFSAAAEVLNKHNVAWLELREPSRNSEFAGFGGSEQAPVHDTVRAAFKGKLVLNQEYTLEQAQETLAEGTSDAISFGRLFITNPNLAELLRENKPLRPDVANLVKWFYSQGAEGYTEFSDL